MIRDPRQLFKPSGPDRRATVSLEPGAGGVWLLRVAIGEAGGGVYGPYSETEAARRFDEAVEQLELAGFGAPGLGAMLEALQSPQAQARARAALRLGWRRDRSAVPALLKAAATAKADIHSIVDALGAIGDERGLEMCRASAERKLLSRRRSGVEALRALGDAAGLAEARESTLQRLPEDLRTAAEADDAEAMTQAALQGEAKRRGYHADLLYELGTPACGAAARAILDELRISRPFVWRYAKSVLKRAMLRHDPVMFGWLSHRIERAALTQGATQANLKSGMDGQKRSTTVFSQYTRNHVRRSTWRYLRNLARWRPALYAPMASAALAAYRAADGETPRGMNGAFARSYLLHRVLLGASERLRLEDRSLRWRFVSASAAAQEPWDEEAPHLDLWALKPSAYVALLASDIGMVRRFGLGGVQRHPEALDGADLEVLLSLLSAEDEAIVELGTRALEGRFGSSAPLELLDRLIGDEGPAVHRLLRRWLPAADFVGDPERVARWLRAPDAETRRTVLECAGRALAQDPEARRSLAIHLLGLLAGEEDPPGSLSAHARLAIDALGAELDTLLTDDALLQMLHGGAPSGRGLAGGLAGRRPALVSALGPAGIAALAEDTVFAVRAGAHQLLGMAQPEVDLLLPLCESRWADTREAALALIRERYAAQSPTLDEMIALCDSTAPTVRALGRALLEGHFDRVDAQEVLYRLSEHPARDMQTLTMELLLEHLKPGFVALSRVEGYLRSVLMNARPDRALKWSVIELLADRGAQDATQGELAQQILEGVLGTQTRADFERVAQALVRVQLQWPELGGRLAI